MDFKVAELSDINDVLELHYKYQIDLINENDKKDGFVTTPFTKQELTDLITNESGLFIAKNKEQVVAYVMAASWEFWSVWPMFQYMIENLKNKEYLGQTLNTKNSFQYGPVCIDKSVRGTGVLELIFDFAREKMSKKYPILVTFINKTNPRSFEAHTRKLGLKVINEFEFNNNNYFELAYDTSKKI